ncbi:DUF3888 domain-containing protein [Bacillus sp. JJ722]|uniref:DUF3888 domain-containing protein n=1 Tax=Bacillus sp. JJ722 TaxID=3122973 RepID=UPI002FFEEA13
MKIRINILLVAFIFFIPFTNVCAEKPSNYKVKKEIYATSQDIFIDMLSPYILKAVRDECGDKTTFSVGRVRKISLIVDHTGKESKRWYEVELTLKTIDPSKGETVWGIDSATFKIDTKTYFGHSEINRTSLEGVDIVLMNYTHHHDTKTSEYKNL